MCKSGSSAKGYKSKSSLFHRLFLSDVENVGNVAANHAAKNVSG
jgi:hypothetical protein